VAHFALICPPFLSHIRAFEALGGALVARGHRATFLHQADVGPSIRNTAIGFKPLGRGSHPPGSLAASLARAARPVGPIGLLRLIHDVSRTTDMLCREAPAALREVGADAVIVDQMEPAGALAAEGLGLPFVSVACALPVNREPAIPLPFLSWPFDPSPRGETRNRGGAQVSDLLMREQSGVIARHAAAFGLPQRRTLADCLSPFAQISQTVPGFDFPRRELPACFHAVGPLRPPSEDEQELELPISPNRPFVFASLGTLQGGRAAIFRKVAQACRDLDVQLLVAHCGGLGAREAESLGATWVTDFAPQRAALRRADVTVTHAGLNTVLDALACAVPLLAIPIAFDQPGTAARIVHAGVGVRLSRRTLTRGKVRAALERLLADPSYRSRARRIQAEIDASGGAARAAEIVEAVERTRAPVLGDHAAQN
jgi:MGT family glycosyltransferase